MPGADDMPLQGLLNVYKLDDPASPEFEALLYTWANLDGDNSRSKSVFLGKFWIPFPITSNCGAHCDDFGMKTTPSFLG